MNTTCALEDYFRYWKPLEGQYLKKLLCTLGMHQ